MGFSPIGVSEGGFLRNTGRRVYIYILGIHLGETTKRLGQVRSLLQSPWVVLS